MQTVLTTVIIAVAVAYLGHAIIRGLLREAPSCGRGGRQNAQNESGLFRDRGKKA